VLLLFVEKKTIGEVVFEVFGASEFGLEVFEKYLKLDFVNFDVDFLYDFELAFFDHKEIF